LQAKIAAAAAGLMILAGGGVWWQWQTAATAPLSDMSTAPAPAAGQPQPAVAQNAPPPSLTNASQPPQLFAASSETSSSLPPADSQPEQHGLEPGAVSPAVAAPAPQPDPQVQRQNDQLQAIDAMAPSQAASPAAGQPDATVQDLNPPNAALEAAVPPPTAGPMHLRATLLVPARSVALERRISVQESLSDHGVLPTTHAYIQTVYRLGTGESFGGASFQASSSDHASGVATAYQPESRAVTLSFSLRSGSFINPWPGSLSGVALVRVRRDEPKQEIEVPAISLALPGQALVKVAEPLQHRSQLAVRMRDPASGDVAVVPVGSTGVLDGHAISVRFEGTALMVTAKPL
jgi:hypothetical protein